MHRCQQLCYTIIYTISYDIIKGGLHSNAVRGIAIQYAALRSNDTLSARKLDMECSVVSVVASTHRYEFMFPLCQGIHKDTCLFSFISDFVRQSLIIHKFALLSKMHNASSLMMHKAIVGTYNPL